MRAALYARVSTQEQADRNYSLELQLEKLRAHAALHNHAVAGEYVDPGYSGTTDQRPALARLIRDLEAGQVDVVVVYKLDRFFRSQRLLHTMLHMLDTHKVGLVSVTESFDTTTPVGRAMLGMLGTFAQLERDTFLERSMDGMRKAVSSGHYSGGIVAYGYRVDDATRALVIDEEEAAIVRRIYRLAADGLTTYAIAVRLMAMGVPTKYTREGRGVRGQATANRWGPGRVRNMLVNPAYKGEWQYGKRTGRATPVLTAGSVPALVGADLWEQAQAALHRNATFAPRNAKRDYLLSGLIACQCGYAYAGAYYDKADGTEVRYYRCCARSSRAPLPTDPCGTPPVQAALIEPLVWDDIKGFLRRPDNVIDALRALQRHAAPDHAGELARVEKRLGEIADAEARLVTLYTGSTLPRAALDRESARLAQERRSALGIKAEIEQERAGAEGERLKLAGVEQTLRSLAARLDAPTFAQQREVVRALTQQIVIGRGADGQPSIRITYVFDGAPGVIVPRTDALAARNHAVLTFSYLAGGGGGVCSQRSAVTR